MRLPLSSDVQALISERDVPLEILTLDGTYDVPKAEVIVTAIAQQGDKTLFVKNNKPNRSWEFPSGHVEPDEHPDEAVLREFTEETGYEAQEAVPMLVLVWAFSDSIITQVIYTVTCGEQIATPVDEVEAVEWRVDLPEMVSFGNLGRETFAELLEDAAVENETTVDDLTDRILEMLNSKRSVAAGVVTGGALIIGWAQRYRTNEK